MYLTINNYKKMNEELSTKDLSFTTNVECSLYGLREFLKITNSNIDTALIVNQINSNGDIAYFYNNNNIALIINIYHHW